MLKLYILHASSRLACRDIQRIQRIQRIQLYSYTRYTAYSTIQPPSGLSPVGAPLRPAAAKKELEEAGGVCAMK